MAHDREVAGLRCSQVLERLSDYLDGDLTPEEVGQVEAHLRGCDWCERFGARMGGVVARLRSELAEAEPAADVVTERLFEHLALDGEDP